MKFSPIVLLLLLMFDGLKGLTLPQERPDGGLNTTLLANFSGVYVKKNPCNNEKMESASYVASHKFHHHAKGATWSDYTNKCSTIISNFLKSISNLIKCNNKQDGTFTFHVNTSVSQNQNGESNARNQRCSLPTIIIEASNCVDSEKNTKENESGERLNQDVAGDEFENQNGCQNLEKALGELSAVSQEVSTSSKTPRKKTKAAQSVKEIREESSAFSDTTQNSPENYFAQNANTNYLGPRQDAPMQYPNDYVADQPSVGPVNSENAFLPQIDQIDRFTVGEMEEGSSSSTETMETVTDEELSFPVSQSPLPSTGVGREESDLIIPAVPISRQPFARPPHLLPNNNRYSFSTTVSPISRERKSENIEEIVEYDSEKEEDLNADTGSQRGFFNRRINPTVPPPQPAESLEYVKKSDELNFEEVSESASVLPKYRPLVNRFEPKRGTIPLEKQQIQTPQQSNLPSPLLTSEMPPEAPGPNLGQDTELDVTQSQTQNSFEGEFFESATQSREGFDYPAPEVMNEESSYSRTRTDSISLKEQAQLQRGRQFDSTGPSKSEDSRYYGQTTQIPPRFPVDDELPEQEPAPARPLRFPGQQPVFSQINNDYDAQPSQDSPYIPEVLNSYQINKAGVPSAESLLQSNEETRPTPQPLMPSAAPQYEEQATDRFQSSQISEQTYDRFSATPIYSKMKITPPTFNPMFNNGARVTNPVERVSPRRPSATRDAQYMMSASLPNRKDYDETTVEDLSFESDRKLGNFNERSKPFQNRPPVTQRTTNAPPAMNSSQRKVMASDEEEMITTGSPARQSPRVKPNFYSRRMPNYSSVAPPRGNRFVPNPPLASDTPEPDFSRPLLTTPAPVFNTPLPGPLVSESKKRIISQESLTNDYDYAIEQPSVNNEYSSSEDVTPARYSESESEVSTAVETESDAYFGENQQLAAPSTGIYESYTTLAPVEPINFVEELELNEGNVVTSENDYSQLNTPTTPLPDYGSDYEQGLDSLTTDYPTPVPLESQPETESGDVIMEPSSGNQVPFNSVLPTFPPPAQSSLGRVRTSEEFDSTAESVTLSQPLDLQAAASPSMFRQPLGPSTNAPHVQYNKKEFPVAIQPRSRLGERVSGSPDVYSQRISSTAASASSSQVMENIDYRDSQYSDASQESYSENQDGAEVVPEQEAYDEIVSSPDARTQIPQPQPLFDYSDYSGQLSNNEREFDTASADSETSTTFKGSESNFQPPVTYSPSPSAPSNTQTFTTESYASDETGNKYSLPLKVQPQPIASSEETLSTSELLEDCSASEYDDQVTPATTPEPFIQGASTTQPPPVEYDEEMVTFYSQPTPAPSSVTLLPEDYSRPFINGRRGQGVEAGNDMENDASERSDTEATPFQPMMKNSNQPLRTGGVIQKGYSNQDVDSSSAPLSLTKYDAASQQLVGENVTLPPPIEGTSTQPGDYAQNFALTTVPSIHSKTIFDEEVITTTDSPKPVTPVPPLDRSLLNERFEGQRRYYPNPPITDPSRQFYPENRSPYYPPRGFPQRHFEDRPYGNYPQPLDFNPQAPRPTPNQFDYYAREQYDRIPNFQRNQFEPQYPAPNRFQPGVDAQRDRFMYPAQPSNYGNRYLPDEKPNYPYMSPPRPDMSSPPQASPNFSSFQRENVFEDRNSQYRPYQPDGQFNAPLNAPPYPQNVEPRSYYPRNDFNDRFNYQSFGPEPRDRFYPDQAYNPMMPFFRNRPGGYFDAQNSFLSNSSQQVEDKYQRGFEPLANPTEGGRRQESQRMNLSPASSQVLADYQKAVDGLSGGEKLVKFDEEVITVSPQRAQDATLYGSGYENRQQVLDTISTTTSSQAFGSSEASQQQGRSEGGLPFPDSPGQNQPMPAERFGPQRTFSNQFQRASSPDSQAQSNANFVNPQNPNGGSEVGSNTSQSESYALGPAQIAPPRKPGRKGQSRLLG